MTNNYRSRSFSFKQFKESKLTSSYVPHSSPTFIATKKTNNCQIIDRSSYLGITYASPQQYYTNSNKNQKHMRIQCRLNIFKKESDNSNTQNKNKHFNHTSTQYPDPNKTSEVFELKSINPISQNNKNQKCLYNFFAKVWKHQCKQSEQLRRKSEVKEMEQINKPKKSKSILLIRKINKRKQQIQKTKEEVQNSFRNKKQIPIHHTQFHFNKRQKKSKTENSPIAARQIRNEDFTIKIHRAVEEILRLRASLKDYNQGGHRTEDDDESAKKFDTIMMIQGGHFSQPIKIKQSQHISKKLARSNFRKTRKIVQQKKEQCEIGPWKRRNTNDFQSLF